MALVKGINCGFVTVAPDADPNETSEQIDNRAYAGKFVAPAGAVKVTEIGFWCDGITEEANFEVAIYTHNVGDNNPEAIVGWDQTNAKGTTAGWKKSTGLNIAIVAGTTYWIAVQLDDTETKTNLNYKTDAGEKLDLKPEVSALIDPWGVTNFSYGRLVGFYAVYETGGPPPTGSRALVIGRPPGVYAMKQCITRNFVYI